MVSAFGCGTRPPDPKDYVARLAADREAKDAQFREEDEPVPKNRKAELLPLAYFPIEPDYNVPAALKPAETGNDRHDADVHRRTAPRSGSSGPWSSCSRASRSSSFRSVDADAPNLDHLTVMFSDLTSGTETYPAGRYIDLTRNATGIYELDFNRAYHPYCYYNESYECPYPPPENRLKLPIRAGERLKK